MLQRSLLQGVLALALATSLAVGADYHVDRRHPAASDDGPGTPAKPFASIARAAKAVRPGDSVLIHSGVYREGVVVSASGTAQRPIVFRAAPGARVVVTGADPLTDWRREEGDKESNVFSTHWPHEYIGWNKLRAHPANDYHRMIGRAEQVLVNNYPLLQVLDRAKLSRGTFYADLKGKRLVVWDRANREVGTGNVRVEASVRGLLWRCTGDHLRLRGIRFRHAANPAQKAAVQILGSHCVLEDCVVERMNALGAMFGGVGNVVRRCVFQDNGWDGFDAGARDLLMTECVVRNNNTKGWNRQWGGGGNKLVLCRNVVIERSQFLGNRGHGIWFDIGNEDCTVRHCLIAGNENAGIFYEISYGLHAHDNVIVGNGWGTTSGAWGADGAISLSSSPHCVVERNLMVANKEGFQFREQFRSTPRIDDRKAKVPVWNHHNVVRHNLLAYNRDAQTAGWFATRDQRHWPRPMQRPADADNPPPKPRRGHPADICLRDLSLAFENNLYAVRPGQPLFQWGPTFQGWRHKLYADLDTVRRELGLEKGSRVEPVTFAGNILTLDFRVPANSPALQMGCYPKGDVPGVRLGVIGK